VREISSTRGDELPRIPGSLLQRDHLQVAAEPHDRSGHAELVGGAATSPTKDRTQPDSGHDVIQPLALLGQHNSGPAGNVVDVIALCTIAYIRLLSDIL
jgi:hypothetical protein